MALAYPAVAGTGNVTFTLASSGPAHLFGWSVQESAGSPAIASATLRDGSASGAVIGNISVLASDSKHVWFGPQGVTVPSGVVVLVRVAGTTTVTLYGG